MIKKKHHYIQRAYLKGFSPFYFDTCEKWKYDQIFVLNKKHGTIKKTSVDKIAFRKNYYSFYNKNGALDSSVEDIFSKVESEFISFRENLRSIINSINFSNSVPHFKKDYRQIISEYVALHFIRVPTTMDWIYEKTREHEIDVSKKLEEPFSEVHYKNLSIRLMFRLFKANDKSLVDFLFDKDIQIEFFGRTKYSLVTSDNPIIRYNHNRPAGISHSDTHVFFPIDRNKFLRFCKSDGNDKFVKHHDLEIVKELNELEYLNAYEEIYGSDESILNDLQLRLHN